MQEVDFQNERHPRFSEFLGAEMKRDLVSYLQKNASASVEIDSVSALQEFNLVDREIRAPYGQARLTIGCPNFSINQVEFLKGGD